MVTCNVMLKIYSFVFDHLFLRLINDDYLFIYLFIIFMHLYSIVMLLDIFAVNKVVVYTV